MAKLQQPKVLIYDIETGGVNALKSDLGFIFCFGYKWLGEKKTHCLRFDKFNGYKKDGYDDSGLLQEARALMDEADLLVAHFGDFFDRKFVNGRLAIHGLDPIPPTKQVDTCRLAWKHFNFGSNRLKALAKTLGCRQLKEENEFPGWWLRGLAGDVKALKLMEQYCKQDVRTLEEVYLKLRAWDTSHVRLYVQSDRCAMCGSKRRNYRGYARAAQNVYHRFQCLNCGKWGRETKKVKIGEVLIQDA